MWTSGGSYNDWADFLTRWGSGQDVDPASMKPLDPKELSGETWQRLHERLWAALDARLRSWSSVLSRELSSGADEFTAGRALTHARHGLRALRALAGSERLPEELRTKLLAEIDAQVASTQAELERSTEALRAQGVDPRRVEARRRTISDNRLTAVLAESPTRAAPTGAWSLDPTASPRRRVIAPE